MYDRKDLFQRSTRIYIKTNAIQDFINCKILKYLGNKKIKTVESKKKQALEK